MTNVDTELLGFIAKLHAAMPQPNRWNGQAARACQIELQNLVDELHRLRSQLIELPWLG